MLLVDLNIDCVDALLHIVPGEKFLTFRKHLPSLLDKSVSVPEGKSPTKLKWRSFTPSGLCGSISALPVEIILVHVGEAQRRVGELFNHCLRVLGIQHLI